MHVAFVIDVFSRRIVGWKASRSVTADSVVDALNMAAWTRRGVDLAGLVAHNDARSQHTSIAHTDRLAEIGATPSIGTVADSYDNAMAESVYALYKTELHRNPVVLAAHGGHWRGLDDLEAAACGWVDWFQQRTHLRRTRRPHPRRGRRRLLRCIVSASSGLRNPNHRASKNSGRFTIRGYRIRTHSCWMTAPCSGHSSAPAAAITIPYC